MCSSDLGKYILQFDNMYSRARAKFIHYCINLTSVPVATNSSKANVDVSSRCGGGRKASNGLLSVSAMNELNDKKNGYTGNGHANSHNAESEAALEIKNPV